MWRPRSCWLRFRNWVSNLPWTAAAILLCLPFSTSRCPTIPLPPGRSQHRHRSGSTMRCEGCEGTRQEGLAAPLPSQPSQKPDGSVGAHLASQLLPDPSSRAPPVTAMPRPCVFAEARASEPGSNAFLLEAFPDASQEPGPLPLSSPLASSAPWTPPLGGSHSSLCPEGLALGHPVEATWISAVGTVSSLSTKPLPDSHPLTAM